MTDSTKSTAQFLDDLRKERDDLNHLIQALERKLGISSSPQISESDDDVLPLKVAINTPSTPLPIGFFHNLSQAAAAEKLLKMSPGRPYSTQEILEVFRSSGMDVNSKNAPTILYTTLKRSPKFERVGSKAWGLKEWYPERKKKLSSKETEAPKEEDGI